jgi:hypothetical protein
MSTLAPLLLEGVSQNSAQLSILLLPPRIPCSMKQSVIICLLIFIDSSFSECPEGVIKIQRNESKILPSQNYQGILIGSQSSQHARSYKWMSTVNYSQIFKFPVIGNIQGMSNLNDEKTVDA